MSELLDRAQAGLPSLAWEARGPVELPTLPPPATPLRPLRRALAKAQRPVILINDSSRIMPRDLPAVLHDLWEPAGKPPVVVATGTHRGQTAALYLDRLHGLPVELHDADDARAHMALSDERLDLRIDRRVARADLVLAFGVVEPHYFAGWSGAHKTATIGVLAREATEANHAHAVSPAASPMVLEGNPVFDGLVPIIEALEEDRRLLCVNHVVDAEGRPLGVGVGTWRGSLERCVRVARRRFVATVGQQVDVLVAHVTGPLSRSLYQADKGLKNNEGVVRDGGDLVLVAPCEEGLGADRFVRLLEQAHDLAAARAAVAERYVLGDHKAVRWRALEARGVRIRVVSPHLAAAAVEAARIDVYPTLEAALARVDADRGSAAGQGLVVEDAALVVCAVGASDRAEAA